ncbi:MAG: FtsX-like permease family protein [Alcaligenaceae bacterium]
MNIFKLTFKQAWRDARAGDLRLLALAVVVAVGAITSVGFLADRVGRALERDAAQMLGADLVFESDTPVPEDFLTQAHARALKTALTWQFPSMVGSNDQLVLSSLKAVQAGYPLRGSLRTTTAIAAPDQVTQIAPSVGEVWVDAPILGQTSLQIGQQLKVGDVTLTISRVITYEPDRGPQFVNLAPRAMFRAEDLARTGLIAPGSRVRHSLLVAGDAAAVQSYRTWLEAQMKGGQKILTIEAGRPEIRRSLDRAQQFLALVAMLAVFIAAVAVALAARRFSQRHRQSIALMRCLGATQGTVSRIVMGEFVLVGIAGSVMGTLLGWGAQFLMIGALGDLIGADLPSASWMPALQGLFAGLWLLLTFAWPPLQALRQVAPTQIFRASHPRVPARSLLGYLFGVAGFSLLMWWIANDLKLGVGLALGFLVASLLFGVVSAAALWALSMLRRYLTAFPVMRFAITGVVRRRAATIAQISALAVGMMAILLLTIVRTDLLAGWQRTLPPDAPNRFLINVQPDQVDGVGQALREAGLTRAVMSPMVRGRLLSRNAEPLSASDYTEERAQRLIEREFNLSYAAQLPEPGQVVAGRDLISDTFEVSLETGLAKTLKLQLGDLLEFDVAGQVIKVTVTSLRRVDWDSMRANFFAIMTPASLKDAPQTYMTAFHLQPEQTEPLQKLVQKFPNLTVFDVGAILGQLQSILDKVSVAVQGLFVFSLFAGALVLAAALSATRDERVREAALMRALGASRRQLATAQRIELLAVGALAGVLAAGGATLAAWALSTWLFEFNMRFTWWPWLLGTAFCMFGAWLAGALALRGVLQTPPLTILRQV